MEEPASENLDEDTLARLHDTLSPLRSTLELPLESKHTAENSSILVDEMEENTKEEEEEEGLLRIKSTMGDISTPKYIQASVVKLVGEASLT